MVTNLNQKSQIESVLIADCGSNTTRVVLIEVVDQAYRFVARGEAPSTLEAPYNDVTIGVLNAIDSIQSNTGRLLLIGGRLLVPQQEDGTGVDAFLASSSAAEPLRVVVAGLVHNVSADSARRASYATYTDVLDTLSLDDYGDSESAEADYDRNDPEAEFSPFINRKDRPDFLAEATAPRPAKSGGMRLGRRDRLGWKERQVARLRRLGPNVVVLAGGADDAPTTALLEIMDVVLEADYQEMLVASAAGENHIPMTLVYAGNRASQEALAERNQRQVEVFVVDNIRPSLEVENLKPVQSQLSALYQERFLPTLPGYTRLRELSNLPVQTTCQAVGLMTQYLARDVAENRVLTLDLGGSSASLFYADNTNFTSIVRGGFGLSYGLSNVLAETSPENLRRWLPFEISNDELINYALNKILRPGGLPADSRELLIEGAFSREILRLLAAQLPRQTAKPQLEYNRLIGTGGLLVNLELWQAALLLLDGLQPGAGAKTGLLELELDSTMLMAACGTLAALNPNAAAYVFRYDCLHRLGSVIVPLGEGKIGSPAVTVKLTTQNGRTRRATVAYGSLALLPLRADEKASLEIRPEGNFRIGPAAQGSVVRTGPGQELRGGGLGLIIDARGRPLHFAADPAQRRAQVQTWAEVYQKALAQSETEEAAALRAELLNPPIDDHRTELVTSGGTPLRVRAETKAKTKPVKAKAKK